MKRARWMPACLACAAALFAAGCQPASDTQVTGTAGAPKAGQAVSSKPVPEGLATTVLNAKGMH